MCAVEAQRCVDLCQRGDAAGSPGGEPVHLQRADADPTQTVSVRYYPPGRDDQREVARQSW
jgi:hypothetical protein